MNVKLQREIASFINLKIRIAFMKSGLGNNCNLLGEIDQDVLFRQIEDQIVMKIEDLDISELSSHTQRATEVNTSKVQSKSRINSAKKTPSRRKSITKSSKKSVIISDEQSDILEVSQELKSTFMMTKDRKELGNIKKDLIAVLSSELEMMS